MPVENGRPSRLTSNHDGRGHDPVTVVGSSRSRVAVSILPTPVVTPSRRWTRCSARIVAQTALRRGLAHDGPVAVPEPDLTPAQMVERATCLRPELLACQE